MSRRVLYEGKVGLFTLVEADLPNGRRVTLQIVEHPGAAAVVPFLTPDRILLLRQYRYAAGGSIWEIPAGKLDPGESPEICAARELEEETGYRAGRIVRLGEILTTPGFSDECITLFSAHDLVPGRMGHGPGEVIEVHEVPLDRALRMVDDGEIVDAKSIVALYHASRTKPRDP
ncbi:MAG: NUDIX hydrolase [Myxococcota bacterium]